MKGLVKDGKPGIIAAGNSEEKQWLLVILGAFL